MTAKKEGLSHGIVILDLDGTLIDSREDIASAVNSMRAFFSLPPLPHETVVSYVGDGMLKLLERSLRGTGISPASGEALKVMRASYRANLLGRTALYDGVAEGLQKLHDGSWRIALLSNKPEEFCRVILRGLGIETFFFHVIGGDSGFPMKPDPAALEFLLERAGVRNRPKSSWMFGDNHTDLEAGRRAGLRTAFAAYGFGNRAGLPCDFVAQTFAAFVGEVCREL